MTDNDRLMNLSQVHHQFSSQLTCDLGQLLRKVPPESESSSAPEDPPMGLLGTVLDFQTRRDNSVPCLSCFRAEIGVCCRTRRASARRTCGRCRAAGMSVCSSKLSAPANCQSHISDEIILNRLTSQLEIKNQCVDNGKSQISKGCQTLKLVR